MQVSTAVSGTAGAGAATAAGADRFYRGNTKTGPWAGINVVHSDPAAGCEKTLFHQKLEGIVLENLVAVFWLIQSQSQGGTSSATLHKCNTQGGIDIIRLHVFFQFRNSHSCYI